MTPRLILVGGFLGAGKTTLLWEAAQRLASRGLHVGLITNDQAPELVDTAFLARGGPPVAEVSGSCFCCNFQGLIDAMSKLTEGVQTDILIAEPVGSCTDLSATIVQPLKDLYHSDFVVSPLSVLVDATRVSDILDGGNGGMHPSAAYIFRKQIEEADIIVTSKTDLLSAEQMQALQARLAQAYPNRALYGVSAKTGAGLDKWLDVVTTRSDAGQRLAEVDYDVYAEGEAVLGWLNATVNLSGEATNWDAFAEDLLNRLARRFDGMNAAVGHVKLMLQSGADCLIGNLTGTRETLSTRGSAGEGTEALLILNARVQMSPEALETVARDELAATCNDSIEATPVAWRCLSPGRPNPTHRYDSVLPG